MSHGVSFAVRQSHTGDAKTDAKDTAIIADQALMRRDLLCRLPNTKLTRDLRMLVAHRTDPGV